MDYSARAVVVPGPELKLHQCGLPRKIARELFLPFVLRRLKELEHVGTVAEAEALYRSQHERAEEILPEVMRGHPVLLSRMMTANRMGMLAFEPVLETPNFAQFVINTADVPAREALLNRLNAAVEAGDFADVRMRAYRLELGPPVVGGGDAGFDIVRDDLPAA